MWKIKPTNFEGIIIFCPHLNVFYPSESGFVTYSLQLTNPFCLNNYSRGHPSFLLPHLFTYVPFVLHPSMGRQKSHMWMLFLPGNGITSHHHQLPACQPDIQLQYLLIVKLVCNPQQNGRKGLLSYDQEDVSSSTWLLFCWMDNFLKFRPKNQRQKEILPKTIPGFHFACAYCIARFFSITRNVCNCDKKEIMTLHYLLISEHRASQGLSALPFVQSHAMRQKCCTRALFHIILFPQS